MNIEVNAPAKHSSAVGNIETAVGLKMNCWREVEDEPDNDSRLTGDRTLPPSPRVTSSQVHAPSDDERQDEQMLNAL